DYVSTHHTFGGDTITLGNGAMDVVALGDTVVGAAGDYIATGTGTGDMVTVSSHINPDTFAFALGTSGANFTTVTGAQGGVSGDQLVVNGGQLGGTLVAVADGPPTQTLASFIASIASPTTDNTYVGNNGADTFVFTVTQAGTGAVEIVGIHTASIA